MRALVAPLYLVASSILGLLATLGLSTIFFQGVLGQDDITYYVPFAGAVLLVALGSDYNVFVAGRIWDEARRMRLHEATAHARAVLRTLDEAVAGDLDYVRAQLSSDYAPLFDGH
jgi:putative drug exporter of the RND superfamily